MTYLYNYDILFILCFWVINAHFNDRNIMTIDPKIVKNKSTDFKTSPMGIFVENRDIKTAIREPFANDLAHRLKRWTATFYSLKISILTQKLSFIYHKRLFYKITGFKIKILALE